ncbi:MAG: Spi family protease inhibitor, partial [Ekhidna sp.]|nr:Spi family protease inhibitor [Ekhidna sp.]
MNIIKIKNLFTKISRNILVLFVVTSFIFSCEKENLSDPVNISNVSNEHFVSLDIAKEIANQTMKGTSSDENTPLPTGRSVAFGNISEIFEVPDENEIAAIYIINFSDDGYIILSADDRTSPIKSFSMNHGFPLEEEEYPLGLVEWLIVTVGNIEEIRQLNIEQSDVVASTWNLEEMRSIVSSSGPVPESANPERKWKYEQRGPLLSTTWGQGSGYNSQAPYVSCGTGVSRALAGCVATAMAQIIN